MRAKKKKKRLFFQDVTSTYLVVIFSTVKKCKLWRQKAIIIFLLLVRIELILQVEGLALDEHANNAFINTEGEAEYEGRQNSKCGDGKMRKSSSR